MKNDTSPSSASNRDKGASNIETGVQTGTDNGRLVDGKDKADLFNENSSGETTDADKTKPEDETQNPLEVGFR